MDADSEAKRRIDEVRDLARRVAEAQNTDVMVYNGPIDDGAADEVHSLITGREDRQPKLTLVLTTFGGDAHEAYRIARRIRIYYEAFHVLVCGYCKSAGTLLVLGADELILAEQAELGPLDVQVVKHDELSDRTSGLAPQEALSVLEKRVAGAFVDIFYDLKLDLRLTTKTAADAAAALATGAYSPVFAQLDPIRVGEINRHMQIAMEYGKRLIRQGKNAKLQTVADLVSGYPSHGFVIDLAEARDLFDRVRQPTEHERALVSSAGLANLVRSPSSDRRTLIAYLNLENANAEEADREGGEEGATATRSEHAPDPGEGSAPSRDAPPIPEAEEDVDTDEDGGGSVD